MRLVPLALLLATAASAQSMPGMKMPATPAGTETAAQPAMAGMTMMKPAHTLVESILNHMSSGTSAEPPSTPMRMYMTQRGNWMLMVHGEGFVTDTQQTADSGRGHDKFFSTNWIMPMAMRRLGSGQLTLRTMLDLEPATVSHGFYPELFQQGETAQGKAIVDGQHPHDFLMELAALYDIRLGERALLSFYAAPVGDPAIGPTAYPHRQSASEDPIAALGHHQEDSTHIAFNVLTTGLAYGPVRVELSGFHGAEPTEARWHFQPSPNGLALDSYATRVTYTPTANLSAQYSIAHLTAPEQLHPEDDQRRQTASVMYNRPLRMHDTASVPGMDMGHSSGNWSTTLLWGQAKSLSDGTNTNSYLLESLLNYKTRNYVWTRVEIAGRSKELLGLPETSAGHVQAYSLGYDRDYRLGEHVRMAPGAQFTVYRTPDPLAATYGRHPIGGVAFLRFRIAK